MSSVFSLADAFFLATLKIKVIFVAEHFAFRGAGGEPPRRMRLWGLTCPAAPAGVYVFFHYDPCLKVWAHLHALLYFPNYF
jgi:hypothetical protein